MSARRGRVIPLLATAWIAATLLLGALWFADRAHRWERPRWHSSFVALRGGAGPAANGEGFVMVPVNPRCPRCIVTLRRLHAAWPARAQDRPLVALIVDAPARPGAWLLRALPPVPVWWDRDGVWRRRWGHRLYGELLVFDAAGEFVRAQAAHDEAAP